MDPQMDTELSEAIESCIGEFGLEYIACADKLSEVAGKWGHRVTGSSFGIVEGKRGFRIEIDLEGGSGRVSKVYCTGDLKK